jgi:hypothetical protein
MNPDNITPPQAQLPAHHVTNSMKIVMLLLGLALIVTLGYFTWFVGSEQETTEEIAPSVKDKTEQSTDEEASACDDATVGYKLYESANLGFCFTYPKAWTLTDGKGADGDKRVWYVSLTDKVVPNSDYPGQVSVNIHAKLADIDSQKTGATTIKDFLDKSAALADPLYADVKEATIGGKAGYTAKSGSGMLSSGTYYFVELTNKTIMEIAVFYDNTDTKALIQGFRITK